MDGKEDDDDLMFDDFYYNPDKQGKGELGRRSSILKQTKNLDLDLCEFEEARRRSQNPKRVSFADTFQVKEYPTGNIYDIPGGHELEASKNSSSGQVGLCSEIMIDNIAAASRESFSVSTLSSIDHQELAVSKENYVGSLALSFLEAEKENLGIVAKYSIPETLNEKTISKTIRNHTEISKNSECLENVQKNLLTKMATSTVSFACDSAQFFDKTKVTFDDMDVTCLPSPKAVTYPDDTNNKTRVTVNDMELTSVAGNVFLDESSFSPPSDDVLLPKSTFTSYNEDENKQLVSGKLNKVAPLFKKELDLSCIGPALSFENIKFKSSSDTENASHCPDFLANAPFSFLDKGSKTHSIVISDGLVEKENVKLLSAVKNTKFNFNEIPTEYTGMGISTIGSHTPQKENFAFDKDSHYSQSSAHGVKFMKMFSEKEDSLNRIQVLSSEKSHFPISSTAFHEDKENVGFNRKRRSTETSKLTDKSVDKGPKDHSADKKPLDFNSENDLETSRDALKHATPHNYSYIFEESNKLRSTHQTNMFQTNGTDISSRSRINSVNLEKGSNDLSEDLKFRNKNHEQPSFGQKSSGESPKASEFECEGMELTSIAVDDSLSIDGYSFEEKLEKNCGKSLHMDNSFGLTGVGRTCHFTSDRMELTCARKYSLELKEMSSNSSLNDRDEYHLAAMSESKNHPFHKNTESIDSRIHHLACVGKENMPLNTIYKESQFVNDTNLPSNISLNDYPNDKDEILNQTLISQEMKLTYTLKTSVASPFLNHKGAFPIQESKSCSPDFKALLNSDNDAEVQKNASNFNKQILFNKMDNSFLVKQKYLIQSNTMDITCNSASSAGNSFNLENSANHTVDEKFGNINAEFSLHNNLSYMENRKSRRFDSEGMELTCVTRNYELPSVNDDSFDVKAKKESAADMNLVHNPKLFDGSRTHHFTSKMELTCAVKNAMDVKTIDDKSDLNSHCKTSIITSESSQLRDKMGLQTDQANVLHSFDVEKENVVLKSMDREKHNKNCHSVETFSGVCKSPNLIEDNNFSLHGNDDKSIDQTFNSHTMEFTLIADKSHKIKGAPFFHLSSPSKIAEEKNIETRDNSCKKFQISQPYSSSLSKNIEKENNPQGSVPCGSPDNKRPRTKQPSVLVSSEDNGNDWDVVLRPLNSKDATLKMPPGLKTHLSQTPGAVYTLRKKRQQITKDFLRECILSPEVKKILRRSERFNLKHPFSEMKAYSPVSYDHKKSSSFHSFGMEGSFAARSEENIQLPTVRAFNSNLKALNENSDKTSIASLTPAPINAIVEDDFKAYSKENIQAPTGKVFNSSLKALNENPGMTSITSLTPAPINALVKGGFEAYSLEKMEPLTGQTFNSSLKALNENSGMTSITSLIPAPNSAFSSFVRSDANLSCHSNKVSILEEKNTQSFSQFQDKQSKNYSLNETNSLLSDSFLNQKELKLTDSLLSCEETDMKCDEVKNAITSKEEKLQNVSPNSKALPNQAVLDLNISEGEKKISIESTKNINLPEKEFHDFQKANNDPALLEKATTKDKILDISGFASKFDKAETNKVSVLKTAVNENKVSEHSKDMASFQMPISKNIKNLSGIKTPSGCRKNSPEKTVLKTDCLKLSEDLNLQNISVDHSDKIDHVLNSDSNQLISSSNEILNPGNNSCINPCKETVNVCRNSTCEIKNQKNYDGKFSSNKMEINAVISRTSNINNSIKDLSVHENETLREVSDVSTTDEGCCSSDSDLLWDLDSLRNKFEEASKGTYWKVKSMRKEKAVFELQWEIWFYKCSILVHVQNINLGKTQITLTPCFDDPDDEYETLGYKFFQFLAKDEIVSFSLFDDDMIKKLVHYSSIANRVEALMRGILHASVDGTHTLSDSLDPLELCVEILNENRMSQFVITFHINLHTYPSEKIIPEVKHLNFKDIKKEVIEAITKIEPGENYLWNMIKVASDL